MAPVHKYTSYDAALAAAVQVKVAVELLVVVAPFAGNRLVVQLGTGTAGGVLKHISSIVKSLPEVTVDLLIIPTVAEVALPEFQV